nr:isopeptide-forming domain-containing fimbrial protein [Rhodopirellula sp. SM50]
MNLSRQPPRRRLSEQLEDRLLFDADVADFIALDATTGDAEIVNSDRPDERAPEIQTISNPTGPVQIDTKLLRDDTTEMRSLGKLSPATAPTPNVSLQLPSEAFLNEEFQFTVRFDNTSTTPSDAGFAPYFDLHVPQGVRVNHATIFGGTLPPIVAGRFNVDGDLVDEGGNPILHPVTGQAVTGTAGDTLLVYQLPFGSFVPEQPDATVLLNATLSEADGASVGTPLDLSAVGFFALGNDPLDNRLTDPPILGTAVTASVTPTVLQLVKTSDAAEAERSTGPNFPITYTLTLKLARGATVEQVLVQDVLPHSHVYVPGSLHVDTTGDASTTEPIAGPPQNAPGNRLAIDLGSMTGTGGVDAVISYQAWINHTDADGNSVLDGASGDDKIVVNDAHATGVYQSTPIADNDDSTDTTVSQQSLSIQQSVSIVNDTGARGATPGDTLEYVMHLQVSDYFEFADLIVHETFSDGQWWNDSFQPLFVIREQGLVSSGTFSQTQHSVTKLTSGTGETEVRFDLASAISDGILTGDLFDDAVSDGGTTVEIRFRTVIEEDFATYFLSGDRSVDAGDPLASSVTVTGRVRDGVNDTQFESDSSGTGVSIVGPAISKSVYAIDGDTDKRNDPIMAGQSITYRLAFSMPTADFENLILTDFLPLPIYKATEVTAFAGGGSSATPPPAGMFSYGPAHTLNQVASATDPPTLEVDGDSNSVRFNFGNFDVVNSDAETIEILFTVTAQDMRFDDGLLLTNQAIATYQLTTTEVRSSNTITQNLAAAPELTITKGMVSTDGTSPRFTVTPAPTPFASPGDTAIPFTGRITGADLAVHPIDANLRDVDAGDRVKVAIAIENSGGADGFNLTIVDALLPQYAVAPSGLNLQVHRGDGTALHFSGDLFTTGIEITDPSSVEGAIQKRADGEDNGSNVILITYDLQLSEDVEINQTYQTSAEIIAYGAIDGGANHADSLPAGSLADDAAITVQNVTTHHSILATSEAHTRFTSGNERVAIGEIVRYQLVVEIPEGTLPDLVIRDRLRSGMQYLDDGTATLAFISDAGISSANGSATLPVGLGGAANSVGSTVTSPTFALPDVNVGSTSSLRTDIDSYNNGTDPQFKLGTLVNRDNDANAEYIVIEFNAVVLNHASAQKNTLLRNDFQLSINPTDQPGRQTLRTSNQANTRVVEPTIDDLAIRVSPPNADAGDKVTFTITFSNDDTVSNSDAFEARLTSRLPDQYTLHTGTIRVQNSGGFGTITDHSIDNQVDIALDQIPTGGRVTVTFDATLELSVQPGEALITPAHLTFTSLPESGTVGNPTGSDVPGGSGSVRGERTGAGGVNHHFDNASALLTVFSPTITKSLVSTSIIDANNGPTETVIGERATYELVVTIPETTMNRAVVVDTLEPGLVFESLDAVAVDSAIVTDLSGPVTPQISGQQVRFNFGNLINAPNDAAPETIRIRYTVRTDNAAGNQGEASGTVLSNAARVTWDLNGVTRSTASAVADVIVIEPELELIYVASPHRVDAGDRVTLDLVVRHTASSDTDAFDIILSESLPIELQHVSLVSAIHSSAGDLSSLFELSPSTNTVTTIAPAVFDLHQGETLTLRVTGVVGQSVSPAQTLTGNADARWTSMDGATAVERTGDGGVNDYRATRATDLRILRPLTTKELVGTSITDAGNSTAEAVIGELVQYRIRVRIPESTIDGARIIDTLDPGLEFVSVDSLAVTRGGAATNIITADGVPIGPPATYHPAVVGQELTFDFGQIINPDEDNSKIESLEIVYTARVVNASVNQQSKTLSNDVQFVWIRGGVSDATAVSSATNVSIIEPSLQIIHAVSTPTGDALDAVTYTSIIGHTADSQADAFDTIYSAALPTDMDITSYTVAHSVLGDLTAGFELIAGNRLQLKAGQAIDIALTDSLTIAVVGTIHADVMPGDIHSSNATIAWSSLNGDAPTERTGADGFPISGSAPLNNYAATDQTTFSVNPIGFSKSLLGTSINDLGNGFNDAVIGELVTYQLMVTLPEGDAKELVISDMMDQGLEFVSLDSILHSAGLTWTTASFSPTIVGDGRTNTQMLTFDLGDVTNFDTDNGVTESIVLTYTARVSNIPTNASHPVSGATILDESAALTYNHRGTLKTTPPVSAGAVTVHEPQLRLDVTVSDHTPSLNQVIRYETTISHAAGSNATAHDLTFLDTLPAGMQLLDVSVSGAAVEFDDSDSEAVALRLDSLPVGQTATIRYDVRVTDNLSAITQTMQNDAVVHWTSLPDGGFSGDNSERDGDGGHAGQDDYLAHARQTSTITHPLVEITQSTVATTPAASGASGNVDITYELTITSTGNDPLTQIAIDEDFSTLFGNGFIDVVVPPAVIHTTADRPLTVNTTYDGTSTNPSIVDNSTGVFNRMLQGESVTIRFTVEVDPDAPGILVDNGSMIAQAQASGVGEVSGLTAVDLSDDPDRPTNVELDPIADDEPDDPNIHRIPMLSLTKQIIGSPVPSTSGVSGNYDVTYQIRIDNNGSTSLDELVLVENLQDHLGSAFVGIVSAPTVVDGDASAVPKLSAEYSGQETGASLIDAAESGRLDSGQFLVIELTIEVDPDASGRRLDSVRDDGSGDFETQAVIAAKDPATGQMVWDRSDDPTDPTNVDGDPANPDDHSDDDNDPDDPVSLKFVEIGVAKRVTHVQRVGMSSLVTIQIMVENTGTVYLENIELLDDVQSQFGNNFDSVVTAPTIVASSATVDPNLQPGYADDPSRNIFDGSSGRLAPGEQILVQLVVQVKPTVGQANVDLVNQAMAAGMPIDAAGRPVLNQSHQTIRRVTDWSDSGTDPATNNPDAPGDTGGFNDPTPTSLTYFTFDGFNNFSTPFDVARQYESESTVIPNRLLSQQIPRLVADPIFSGTARPGARILATLYDSDGYQIVSASVFADMGGNWMMQFQGLDQEEEVRVEFEEISTAAETFASTGDSFDALGLPHGKTHYHSLQPWTAYDDRYEFNAVYRGSARQSLASEHRHANRPIEFGG